MKYRKFNKYEKKILNKERIDKALHGEGMYLFENNTDADMKLPRPTKSGLREVGPREQFQGDNYYMFMVQVGHLRLIKELQSPAQEKAANEAAEAAMNPPEPEKLILDQPDTITEQGKVEHVQTTTPLQPLDEADENQPKPDVLLNETPIDDGFVIIGD